MLAPVAFATLCHCRVPLAVEPSIERSGIGSGIASIVAVFSLGLHKAPYPYTERPRCAITACHAVRFCNARSLRPALPCCASPPPPKAPKARSSRRVIRITPTAISAAAPADNSNHRRRARWLQGKSARMAGAAFTSRSEGGAVGALSNTGWVVPFGAP